MPARGAARAAPQVAVVEDLVRGASALIGGHGDGGVAPRDVAAAAALRSLLLKDGHRIRAKEDYHVLRTVIRGGWGSREPPTPSALSEEQLLLLALVVARPGAGRGSALPLDGALLAAQALFHALPDDAVLALLAAMGLATAASRAQGATTTPFEPSAWDADTVLALHHGLLASAAVLVPHPDGLDGLDPDRDCRKPCQIAPAGGVLRAALVDAVVGHTLRVTLTECRATSRRTKPAFKMLHAYLCTMTRWRRVPAELDEILMLVWTAWEVPLPGVREVNEAVLEQLQDLALRSAAWGRADDGGLLQRLRDPEAHWAHVLHGTSWRCKVKYLLLKVLAPRLGRAALLRDLDAVLMDGLLLAMADPHLASAATAVYRAALDALPLEEWSGHCLPHVVRAVAGPDRKLAMNVLNYWVGPTVKALPDALPSLLRATGPAMRAAMAGEASATHGHAAHLHLLKIGRRDGFWDPDDASDEVALHWSAVEWGLHHSDAWLRGLALSAVCVSARPRRPVGARELDAARRFLCANVRADDVRLRHTLLEALGWLLMRLRNALRPLLARPEGDAEGNAPLVDAVRFLADLHRFLLDGLQPGANYQRRVTCLRVYSLLLSYLGPAGPDASGGLKKGVSREPLPPCAVLARHLRLGSAESRRVLLNCIMDPADDVRNMAAEVLVMLPEDEEATMPRTPNWDHVLALCNSQLFFHAESGAVLGSVLCPWNEESVRPDRLVALCEEQLAALRADVLTAASGGQPLHGLLGLLRRLLPPRGHGPPGRPPPGRWAGTERRLLQLLEDNVDLCLSLLASRASAESAFAPSFAEMGEAIDSMVSRRGDGEDQDDDCTSLTLSPAHQLVLNCIWLNLKASCALASDLVEVDWPPVQDAVEGNVDALRFAERCARLPVAVLTRCRHKGAIESAGASLQQAVKALTEHPDTSHRDLPNKLLMEFLQLLLQGSTAKGTSVSRRSAGMAILVHRIVLGDQQPDKPMLHECISCLFALLNMTAEQNHLTLEESQHDLPQTQALHFLRTLIADASLRVFMSPYLGPAALSCFHHLNSPVWSVRNASLQLFGALVPKIVGQGKCTGETAEDKEDDTLVGCITFEDLVVRFDSLSKLLLSILEAVPADRFILRNHAELIPTLSLLSRLTVIENMPWSVKELNCFKQAFLQLFSSPIAVVRSLAAKAFSRFTPLLDSADEFEKLLNALHQQSTENGRCGVLATLKLIKDRLNTDGQLTKALCFQQEKISALIHEHLRSQEWSPLSFESQAILLSIMDPRKKNDSDISQFEILDKINVMSRGTQVGITNWITVCIKQIFTRCRIEDIPNVLDYSLQMTHCTDVLRVALLCTSKRLDEIDVVCVLQEISNVCIEQVCQKDTFSNHEAFLLFNLLLKIIIASNDRHFPIVCDINSIAKIFHDSVSSRKYGARCAATALPVVAGLTLFSYSVVKTRETALNTDGILADTYREILYGVLENVKEFRCPVKYNETFRFAAATTLQFAGTLFIHLLELNSSSNNMLICEAENRSATVILETSIQLLQDEDGDIRDEASKFVTSLFQDVPRAYNSLECLDAFFTLKFLLKFLKGDCHVMFFLWQLLSSNQGNNFWSKNATVENPFDHGSKNIFAEDMLVVEKAGKLISMIAQHNQSSLVFLESCDMFINTCQRVQEDINYLKTLCQRKTQNNVWEEWQASTIHVLHKKIEYRLDTLRYIYNRNSSALLFNDQKLLSMSLDLTSCEEKFFFDDFSFYL